MEVFCNFTPSTSFSSSFYFSTSFRFTLSLCCCCCCFRRVGKKIQFTFLFIFLFIISLLFFLYSFASPSASLTLWLPSLVVTLFFSFSDYMHWVVVVGCCRVVDLLLLLLVAACFAYVFCVTADFFSSKRGTRLVWRPNGGNWWPHGAPRKCPLSSAHAKKPHARLQRFAPGTWKNLELLLRLPDGWYPGVTLALSLCLTLIPFREKKASGNGVETGLERQAVGRKVGRDPGEEGGERRRNY